MGYTPSVSVRGWFQLTSFVERLHHTSDGQLLLMSIKMISSQFSFSLIRFFPPVLADNSTLSASISVVAHINTDY